LHRKKFLHGKNDFAEISKNLDMDTVLKIILLDYQNKLKLIAKILKALLIMLFTALLIIA